MNLKQITTNKINVKLNVIIKLALNLLNLIDNFQSKEPLVDENAYHCTVCNDLTFAIKTMNL